MHGAGDELERRSPPGCVSQVPRAVPRVQLAQGDEHVIGVDSKVTPMAQEDEVQGFDARAVHITLTLYKIHPHFPVGTSNKSLQATAKEHRSDIAQARMYCMTALLTCA
jgi:hypothetical protein